MLNPKEWIAPTLDSDALRLHEAVIHEIHNYDDTATPFAIHEIVRVTGISRSSVIRVLTKLVEIGLVLHNITAFRGRHYRTSPKWTSPEEVAKEYEMALLMRL